MLGFRGPKAYIYNIIIKKYKAMKNLILKSFLAISILTSVVLLVLKFTGHLDISLFNAMSFAFIPNLAAFIPNMAMILFNRFEAFVNVVLNILMF
jgi:hypothetical protein